MRTTIVILVTLLFVQQALAQSDNAHLLVQSPDGKKVMLVWFLNKWNGDLTGFDIKRKEGLQAWVKLNSEPIVPGISMKKKLMVVDANKNEANKLEARLYKLLASHKLKETANPEYLQRLASDEKALQDLSDQMAHDYGLALMNGFAFVDYTITRKTTYQYGLFVAGTDKLLASVSWNYGEIPNLNTIREITSKATTNVKGVQLIWEADADKMKAADVTGFNIYRQGLRLNNNPIMLSDGKEPFTFTWNDRSANSSEQIQYSISAESIFGIEGIIKPYIYDPADHPNEYKKTLVTDISSLGYYFKDGISIKWNFPKEDERFLKGFYVEKDNMPGGYARASTLLDPSARTFIDKTPSSVNSYIRVRVIAVYNDRTSYAGAERLYSYFPVNEPPAPQNMKARLETRQPGNKDVVHLSWDGPINGDNMTDYYRVYYWTPDHSRFYIANNNKPVRGNSFNYVIEESIPGVYKFCVSAIGKSTSESAASDTASVSIDLPEPLITNVVSDSGRVTVQWQYPGVPGLRGFRLFENNNVIADEDDLKENTRTFVTPRLAPGNTYKFSLRAISETGVISEYARPVSINLP